MTLEIVFHGAPDGDDGPFFLCSIGAWGEFGEWAAALPGKFGAVKVLFSDGEVKDTSELSEQLSAAVKAYTPPNNVLHTIQALQNDLGVGDPEETATVIS